MHAVRIHEFGGPDVLHLDEVPMPALKDGELLVHIHAASANPIDYKLRAGWFAGPEQLPLALGRDIAGTVERCGPAVEDFLPGDQVYAMLPEDRGGYADYVAVPAAMCATMPQQTDYIAAAAVPLAGLTAWQGLFDEGRLEEGQHVLIHGGAGGLGHLAIQLAKAKGAMVIATCAGEDTDFVRGLGADRVIDYKTERFEDSLHDIDLVLDLVAGETQDRSWSVLKAGGALISTVAPPSQEKAEECNVRAAIFRCHPDGHELAEIGRLIDDGKVKPVVDRVYPLNAIAEAERYLEEGHVRGKIVLRVS